MSPTDRPTSGAPAHTPPTAESDRDSDRGAALTRWLLRAGIVVGPFYLAVGLIQAFVRAGFSFARHPLSVLANGPGGWVQTANFVISGLLVLAASWGLARSMRPRGRVAGAILGVYGLGMIAAAMFPMDPVDGFPVGTPVGPPTTISTSGLVHFAAGSLGFLALAISCLVFAFATWRRREPTMAVLSLLAGLTVVGGFFAPFFVPGLSFGVAGIWLAVVVGWAWLSALSARQHGSRRSTRTMAAPA